jgi:hypothetical protein
VGRTREKKRWRKEEKWREKRKKKRSAHPLQWCSASATARIGTFGDAVEHVPWVTQVACDGGDMDNASSSGDGSSNEERVRELAEMEA